MASLKMLYERSILLEIVNKNNPSEVVDAFTLIIPPESIEIVQSQRVSRTPTFGGIFEDDYGLGNSKITISGNTGNTDIRTTYIPTATAISFSGKDAIYAIRDRIFRYKNNLEGKGFDNYEVRMYDLSTNTDEKYFYNQELKLSVLNSNVDGWIVSLDDFKISRNKDKPLWYNYNIELFGITPLGVYRAVKKQDPNAIKKDFLLDALAALKAALNAIRNAYQWSTNILNQVDNVFKIINDLETMTIEYVQAAGSLAIQGFGFYSKLFELAKFPSALAKSVLDTLKDVTKVLSTTLNTQIVLDSMTEQNAISIGSNLTLTRQTSSRLSRFGKSQDADTDLTLTIDDEQVTIYGTTTVIATASTTLVQLAVSNYGDPSRANLIAVYNGITDEDILPGTVIKIPLLVRGNQTNNNEVYNNLRVPDYGKDIEIDANGAFVIYESGDFAIVEGSQNIVQAINLRLNETLGARLRLTTYGLSTTIGSAQNNTAPINYILTNIHDTLMQDPRIKNITNISIQGNGDTLYVTFNVETNYETLSYQGAI